MATPHYTSKLSPPIAPVNEEYWGLDKCQGKGVELAEETQKRLINELQSPIKCYNCEE